MFGNSILVAPKLHLPNSLLTFSNDVKVDYYLPQSEKWYYYYSKKQETNCESKRIPEHEQGMFMRGGSIIPMLMHNKQLALLRAINDPIELQIYLDRDDQAEGLLYLDDGHSFRYKTHNEKTLMHYSYEDGILTATKLLDSEYHDAFEKQIDTVSIYGISSMPSEVRDTQNELIGFAYDQDAKSLQLEDLLIPVDDAMEMLESVQLLKIKW